MRNRILLFSVMLAFSLNSLVASAGNFVGNGGDANAMEFTWLARVVTKRLAINKTLSASQRQHVAAIAKAIDETRVASADKLVLRGQEVDAINYPDRKLIVLRRGGWEQMKRNTLTVRFGFVLHEFSGVAKFDDGQYAKSQALVGQLFEGKSDEIPFEEQLLDSFLTIKSELNSAYRFTDTLLKKTQNYDPRGVCYSAGSLRSLVTGLSMLMMTGRPRYVGYNPDEQIDRIDKASRDMKVDCATATLDRLSFRKHVQVAMDAIDALSASMLPKFDLSKPE